MPTTSQSRPRDDVSKPVKLDAIAVLRALADPVRLDLVRQLRESMAPIACGAFDVAVAKNTLSHHFKTLREAGVIVTHREGTAALNVLQEDELDEAFPGLLDAILPRRG
ncbi:ArsR/SmtB family transcription factor [Streptomyces sp. NPDC050507]|uniref:ArsR/SmtB family transcription factor n=1 Tax=Streptomyces sp. NPDC050507 TaxID=3365619 RepID=UPI0037B641B3